MDENEINLDDQSKVQLDIKSLIGIVFGIVSLAGVWFTLTAEISQLQLDVIRMQDDVELNHEFRVKWPRGEMGALPDDAKQDLRIAYLQKEVEELRKTVKELEIENAKK
jgi:HAMP domain-containing protein